MKLCLAVILLILCIDITRATQEYGKLKYNDVINNYLTKEQIANAKWTRTGRMYEFKRAHNLRFLNDYTKYHVAERVNHVKQYGYEPKQSFIV